MRGHTAPSLLTDSNPWVNGCPADWLTACLADARDDEEGVAGSIEAVLKLTDIITPHGTLVVLVTDPLGHQFGSWSIPLRNPLEDDGLTDLQVKRCLNELVDAHDNVTFSGLAQLQVTVYRRALELLDELGALLFSAGRGV